MSSTKGKGMPVPDPPSATDTELVMNGPHALEIARLLDENTAIAEKDWAFRSVLPRRTEIWVRLRELGVTMGRICRSYAVDKTGHGKPESIVTHVGVLSATTKAGFVPHDQREESESE